MRVFGRGGDDASRFEHVGEDSFFEELACSGFGHRVAESSLCDFAGGVVYEDDGGGVFWEGVGGVDFFRAVDRVGDGCDDIASWDACEHGDEREGSCDGVRDQCVHVIRSVLDLVWDDIGFFVFVEEPGGAVDESVGEFSGDGGFWDVVTHVSCGVWEGDADRSFEDGVVGEGGVGLVDGDDSRDGTGPYILVPGFVEGVLDDFDDDESFDSEHDGDVFAGHRGPLWGVVEDGEEIV